MAGRARFLGSWPSAVAGGQGRSTSRFRRSSIRSCILIFYYGGPSHLDTFDPKPLAPAEVRGEFGTIASSLPGLVVSEHLPQMARVMHKVTLIRSMHHAMRLHDAACVETLTGRSRRDGDGENFTPPNEATLLPARGRPSASCVATSGLAVRARRPAVRRSTMSCRCPARRRVSGHRPSTRSRSQAIRTRSPIARRRSVWRKAFPPPAGARRGLCWSRSPRPPSGSEAAFCCGAHYEQAFDLLGLRSGAAGPGHRPGRPGHPRPIRPRAEAAELSGRAAAATTGPIWGSAATCAARTCCWPAGWSRRACRSSTCTTSSSRARTGTRTPTTSTSTSTTCCRRPTRRCAALIEDLDERGLLDTTLVVAMGEFGRTPQINAEAGRDHWPDCYTRAAGRRRRQGRRRLRRQRQASARTRPRDPVTPGDLAATIFSLFGIDPATEIHDTTGRPYRVAEGRPLRELLA